MKSLTSDQYVVTILEEIKIKKLGIFYKQIFIKLYTKMLKFLNISDFLIGISSCSETPSKCAITI